MVRSDYFNLQTLGLLREHWIAKVIALDIETHVVKNFLDNENILGVSFAVRTSGDLTSKSGIESITFISDEESDDAEVKMLRDANEWLAQIKPLGVIGYGSRGYDIPWLQSRNTKHQRKTKDPLWSLINMLQDTVHVDLYFLLRSMYKARNLRSVLEIPELQYLPLQKSKGLVSEDFDQKGKDIVRMWQEDRESFKRYVQSDAVNPLLIAEHLLLKEGA